MRPIVHGLAAKYTGQIDFVYLDIDDPATADLRAQLRFRVQPQFVLLDGQGQPVKQWLGAVRAEEFVNAFAPLLP